MSPAVEEAVSIIITTHNRATDLHETLEQLAKLEPQTAEILVCADGCTDGTQAMLQRRFANCRVLENTTQRGSVFCRDRLLRAASTEIVISLDDDSYPVETNFISEVRDLFERHPEVAVFSFPELREDGTFADPRKTPASAPHAISAYANCAAAMRRSVYLRSAGFPALFFHMYEEPDYALQCFALGYSVQFYPGLTVRHRVSAAQRNSIRRHHLNARNELWSVVMRCPLPQLLAVAPYRIWRQFLYACSQGWRWALSEPSWWVEALNGLHECLQRRSPLRWSSYYAWMKLARACSTI